MGCGCVCFRLGVLIVLVSASWHNFYVFWVLVYCVVSLLFAVRFVGLFWFIVCCCCCVDFVG